MLPWGVRKWPNLWPKKGIHKPQLAEMLQPSPLLSTGSRALQNEGGSMSLTRDKIIGHDTERLAFKFTMLNGEKIVPCQISDAAMDELAGAIGTESSARQAQFLSLRDEIEGIASDLFAQAPPVEGYVVRIFTKHVKQRGPAAAAREAEGASSPVEP
jgi:Protein of unknown function (DUF1488)